MAKVITPAPELPLDRQATCNRCKCQFAYGKHEIRRKEHCLDGGWSGIGIEYIVKCPNCEYEQVVGSDFIPPK